MSLLAPLYIAGTLAIALPILFHLIRRTPQGRQAFSSLMFLAPSPPRITRRSRLSNILLLILRAAALALLAFAFARPFLNRNANADVRESQGRRLAIMVDTSASMQRGDLWQQATRQFDQVLSDLKPTDEVALYFFDRQVRPGFTFAEWNQLDQPRRLAMLKGKMAETKPTYSGTNVGSALASVADQLSENQSSQKPQTEAIARQIVLITDLQQGAHADALQGHQWPANVSLDVKLVALKDPTNATVQFVKSSPADDADSSDPAGAAISTGGAEPKLRVRVSNQPDSKREQFTLAWANDRGPISALEPTKVYIPPGRSQISRLAWPAPQFAADRLILQGDDCDFDNTLYLVAPRQDLVRVVYLGDDDPDDVKGMRFYLERVVSPTPLRKVEILARRSNETLSAADLTDTRLVVATSAQPADRTSLLRQFVQQGGDVLWVLKDQAAAQGLASLLQVDSLNVEEASGSNYSLINRVVLDHPLFAPFADSRFSDFTKIHFWKHRRVEFQQQPAAAQAAPIHVLASFDDSDPFLLEQILGQGRVLVATSGWQPADSQLALSTKFVPLIDGLLRRRDAALVESQYFVDDAIAVPALQQGIAAPPPPPVVQTRSIRGPDGRQIELPRDATVFDGADHPGVYHLQVRNGEVPLAVNLPADESRTSPIPAEDLAQWGAKLGSKPVSDQAVERARQLQVLELENKQKLWRWVIVAVLGILVVETALAGTLARKSVKQPSLEQQVTT